MDYIFQTFFSQNLLKHHLAVIENLWFKLTDLNVYIQGIAKLYILTSQGDSGPKNQSS